MASWWQRIFNSSPRETGPHFDFLDAEHRPILVDESEESSGIRDARDILRNALLRRASDIHVEPGAAECRVRLRVDGSLSEVLKAPAEDGLRIVAAIKALAQMDTSERRKAQDGRFGGCIGQRAVDFRVSSTPAAFGEKLVLRVLDLRSGVRNLNDLGMPQEMMDRFARTVQSRNGMILATGPTGSGKTSTLYAALRTLDSLRLNVVTIEDPIEYELEGATQIALNPKAGVTYESGLRSILRQDPDVILVGEIRDLESAQIALRSALTGHLVFTSLHTRDAIGTLMRLEDMGIERHLLASALFVLVSQRLVKTLCPDCREAYPCRGDELVEIGIEFDPGDTIFRAVGCSRCDRSGYLGRTGVFEMLVLDEELRRAITTGANEDELTKLARSKGYRNYREDAAVKVLQGLTTVEEVLRAN